MVRRHRSHVLVRLSCAIVLAAAWMLAPLAASAFRPPDVPPAPEFDIRGPRATTLPAPPQPAARAQAGSLDAVRGAIPDLTVKWSALTQAPSRIYSTTQALTGPAPGAASDIAMAFLVDNRDIFNLTPQDLSEVVFTRQLLTDHNGVTHLTLQQRVHGIEVFGALININVDRDGRVWSIGGELMPGAHASINTQAPVLTSDAAAALAAASAGVEAVRAIRHAGLVYFPLALGNLRLAWDVVVEDGRTPNIYRTLVDAADGAVLWRENLTEYAHITTHGEVFDRDSPLPNNPIGTPVAADRVDRPFHGGGQVFPVEQGTPLFPHDNVHYDWWAGLPRTRTLSNNVVVQEDRDGDNRDGFDATDQQIGDFSYKLELTQDPITYTRASIVNLFYWNNRLHDIWYRYGFDEKAGNFQSNNFGLNGLGGDEVLADAQDGRDNPNIPPTDMFCNAFMQRTPDGQFPRMEMLQCNRTKLERDGALDNGVIIHEYHHGLAHRLKPTLHVGLQGRGLGEGGGDFQAITVLGEPNDDLGGRYGIGGYLFDLPTIRRAPYSVVPGVYRFSFGNMALSPPGPRSPDIYEAGEVWANALWIARALLIGRHEFVTGTERILQLQIDGYKSAGPNPDFLDMRDAILQADTINDAGANWCLLWQAFARMGMGWSATTTGQSDRNPVEAFDVPPPCAPESAVSYASGKANGVGRGAAQGGMSLVGKFTYTGDLALNAVPAIARITALLREFSAAGELVQGVPLVLDGDPRNTIKTAVYESETGKLPIVRLTIGAKGRGVFTFRLEVSQATITVPLDCPATVLRTAFALDDGTNPPVPVEFDGVWGCSGTGNRYLRTP
jgi:hypothetical protein